MRPGKRQELAEDTGEAHAVDGALANSGVLKIAGDLVLGQGRPVLSSGYLHEVAQLAAVRFEGRAAELAAMAAFSTAPDGVQEAQGGDAGTAYWRWLAPAWSGKTALMAQFALHPPQGVDVLAFFITARAAGRSDRTAFLAALQGQLREFLCDADVDCASQGQFLDALERAADRATAEGRRLVLLVDGLDEDTGVESASSGYSIAALLPRVPPPGLRIVVAGRPNPPIPSDVLENHPLHSAHVDHLLAPSPAAQALRKAAERDLHALLTGGGSGREVACLIAAANGGLSAQDLADLMGEVSAWEVEEVLGGSLGRSFQPRPAQWQATGQQPEQLFSFAHEELQQGALKRISTAALEGYRARVHAFTDAWRQAGWPADTPEYALVGYPQLLRNLADTTRLTVLATDAVRHERLWETTGSDTEALAEIADAIGLHRAATNPNLRACVRLAQRRDEIRGHVASIPDDVIETWAIVGHVRRALTLAQVAHGSRRIPDLVRRLLFAGRADHNTASLVASVARQLLSPVQDAWELRDVADALCGTGHPQQAADLARSIARPDRRDDALATVVGAMARSGDPQQAAELGRGITDPDRQAGVLASAARALARSGRQEQAVELARSIADPQRRNGVLGSLSAAASEAADDEPASAYPSSPYAFGRQARIPAELVEHANFAKDQERAAERARGISDPDRQAKALGAIAKELALSGFHRQATELADEAARLARGIVNQDERDGALTVAARAVARKGHHALAAELARAVIDTDRRADTLAAVAVLIARAGARQQAAELADEAAELARGGTALGPKAALLAVVAEAMTLTGRHEQAAELAHVAAELAHDAKGSGRRAMALTLAARAIARTGRHRQAIDIARMVTEPDLLEGAYGAVAVVIAHAGHPGEAIELTRRIDDPDRKAKALAAVATALAHAGRHRQAADLALSISRQTSRVRALTLIIRTMVRTGHRQEAVELSRTAVNLAHEAGDANWHARTLATAAEVLAHDGHHEQAVDFAQAAAKFARTLKDPGRRAAALAGAARALTSTGCRGQAEGVGRQAVNAARTIKDPGQRVKALTSAAKKCPDILNGRVLLAEALDIGPLQQVVECLPDIAPETLELLARLITTKRPETDHGRTARAGTSAGHLLG
ncbi:hypothetical protein G3I77_39765 [Streptomyces sp. D2-8]|uniref:hypothetical protein n=1 Tax=Streptomyces sp. D2-8 TaxID=2707767 RepID=UPI0020BE5ABA|nr:hypothetical protein [Streptomyces sp. D2-8]MCK8438902.1 hypothetical protein [Streptomyces sp. D2-8]